LNLTLAERNRLVTLLGPHQPPATGAASSSSNARGQVPTDDRWLCVICLANERKILFMPCKHLVSCAVCCKEVKCCPICRGRITKCETFFNELGIARSPSSVHSLLVRCVCERKACACIYHLFLYPVLTNAICQASICQAGIRQNCTVSHCMYPYIRAGTHLLAKLPLYVLSVA
jgi:hypothetical protein